MSTDVAIASRALLFLGEKTITALDDGGSEKGEVVSGIYPTVRDSMIAGYPWRFSMKKQQLSQDVTAPLSEWPYSYAMPADNITGGVQELRETAATLEPPYRRFEVYGSTSGEKLYTDLTTAWLDYQFTPDEANWPAHFAHLMALALAAHMCDALTDSTTKAQFWWQTAFGPPSEENRGGYFRTARQIDARVSGDYGARLEQHDLINVRG